MHKVNKKSPPHDWGGDFSRGTTQIDRTISSVQTNDEITILSLIPAR